MLRQELASLQDSIHGLSREKQSNNDYNPFKAKDIKEKRLEEKAKDIENQTTDIKSIKNNYQVRVNRA